MMKTTIFLIASTILLSSFQSAKDPEIKLGKIKIFNDLIEIKIPSTFTVMHDYEVKKMYPEGDLPKIVYANSERDIRLALSHKKNSTVENQFKGVRTNYLAEWQKSDPKLKELSNGGTTVDGRDMGFISVLHKSPEKLYRFVFICDYKGMLLNGELICPKKGYKPWIEIGNEIMNSVDLK